MILALVLAQASAVDAERAFAADAKKIGQWTAFRKWATDDATMFWPQPVRAQDKLKTLPNPPKSIEWRPARSFVSCDGTLAANTGPWRDPGGHVGYFSTIWFKQSKGGWKWMVDGGDAVVTPRFDWNAETIERRAACSRPPPPSVFVTPQGAKGEWGGSTDGTIAWRWWTEDFGARVFQVDLWNGIEMERVINDRIAAPRPADL